jgi:hypothetical protein
MRAKRSVVWLASHGTSAAYEERGSIMIKLKINGQEQNWDGDPDPRSSGLSVMKWD